MIEALLDVWKGVGWGSEKLMVVVRGQEAMLHFSISLSRLFRYLLFMVPSSPTLAEVAKNGVSNKDLAHVGFDSEFLSLALRCFGNS